MIARRPRQHNEAHLDFIRSLPCLVTGSNVGVDAAHIRSPAPQFGKRGVGMGEKPSDVWVVPLCRSEHEIQHGMSERSYWALREIDPCQVALALYAHSGDAETAEMILHYWRR